MRRSAPILVLLLVVAATCASLAGARDGRAIAKAPRLTAESAEVAPGDTLVLHGNGFPRRAHVALLAGPPNSEAERIGGATTGRRGTFRAEIRIRVPSETGDFVALACHDGCRVKASVRFRIVAR